MNILSKPKVMGIKRANILAQITAITLLLSRAFKFILKVTSLIQKSEYESKIKLDVGFVPKPIHNLIQRE